MHSPAVGPGLLGLLGLSPDICRITGSHLIHGKASVIGLVSAGRGP